MGNDVVLKDGSGNKRHLDYKLRGTDYEVIVHFRCRWCGRVMPAVSLNGGEMFELSWSMDARNTLQTCDTCHATWSGK